MAKLLRKAATRVNKAGFNFNLDVTVERLEQPSSFEAGSLSVSLSKSNSKKAVCTREMYITDPESSWGETLSMKVTLYRDKAGAYDAKLYDLELRNAGGKKVLAKFVLDAAAQSSVDGRSETLALHASGKKKGEEFVLMVTVKCQYVSPAAGPGSEASSMNSMARGRPTAAGSQNTSSTQASSSVPLPTGARPPMPPPRTSASGPAHWDGAAEAPEGENDQDLSGFDGDAGDAESDHMPSISEERGAPPMLPPKSGASVRRAGTAAAANSISVGAAASRAAPSRDPRDAQEDGSRGGNDDGSEDGELGFERRRVQRLELELEALIEEKEAVGRDLAAAGRRADAARAAADAATVAARASEARAVAAEAKLVAAAAMGQEGVAELEEEVAALRQQNDRLAEALEASGNSRSSNSGAHGGGGENDAAEIIELREELANAKERCESLEDEIREQKDRFAEQARLLSAQRQAASDAANDAAAASGDLVALAADKRVLEQRVKALEKDLEKASAATAAAQAQAAQSFEGRAAAGSFGAGAAGGSGSTTSAAEAAAEVARADVEALLDEKQALLQRIKQLEKDVVKAKSSRGAGTATAATSPMNASDDAAMLRRKLQDAAAEQEELETRVRELKSETQKAQDAMKQQRSSAAVAEAATKRLTQELEEMRELYDHVVAEKDSVLHEASKGSGGRASGPQQLAAAALQQQQQLQQQQHLEAEVKRLGEQNSDLSAKVKALESGPPPVPPRRGSAVPTSGMDQANDLRAQMIQQQKEYEQKILELIQDMTTQREAWQRMCDEVEKERDDTAQELIHAKVQLAQTSMAADDLRMQIHPAASGKKGKKGKA